MCFGRRAFTIPEEVPKDLGKFWQTLNVCLKPYSAVAGNHSTIDRVRNIQSKYSDLKGPKTARQITEIRRILAEPAYSHGGWKAARPLTATGAHMSNAFAAATQFIHGSVLPAVFAQDKLENEDVWNLVSKTECELNSDTLTPFQRQTVEITQENGQVIRRKAEAARGVDPRLENQEIVENSDELTKGIIDVERSHGIKELSLHDCEDILEPMDLLSGTTRNPIA